MAVVFFAMIPYNIEKKVGKIMQNRNKQSQNKSSGKKPATTGELLQIAARPVIFLLCLIMVCAFLAHYLLDSETLSEYAENNPELAYGDDDGDSRSETETAADEGKQDSALTRDEHSAYNTAEENRGEAQDFPIMPEDNETMTADTDRTVYQDGFYYEPLSDSVKERITGVSYPAEGCTVPYEDLNYVGLLYVDFNGDVQEGELICNAAIAQDMVEIFYELYRNDYRIERVRLVDEYGGDDTLSMEDNNTSCFNYRVVDGTSTLSKHALGCAIDINPFYNPYVVFNRNGSRETYISPKGSEIYADRSQNFPYKIDENDLCYKLFTEHGFTWGGNWNSTKDYQHFQITLE